MKKLSNVSCIVSSICILLIFALTFTACENKTTKKVSTTYASTTTTNSTELSTTALNIHVENSTIAVASTIANTSTTTTPQSAITTINTTLESTTKIPTNSEYINMDFSKFYFDNSYDAWVYCPSGILSVYNHPTQNSDIIKTEYNKNVMTIIGKYTNWFIVKIDDYNIGFVKEISENVPLLKIRSFEKSADIPDSNLVSISSATSSSSSDDPNRATNLQISSDAASIIVKNGDTFSMNQATGPRSSAAGYKEASIFVNGQVTEGLGGGVCQTTTTIHMAVQNAISTGYNLEILEANKHSRPVGYVTSRDQEAMVNWGSSDFKFVNHTGADIAIIVTAQNQTVTAEIFLIK